MNRDVSVQTFLFLNVLFYFQFITNTGTGIFFDEHRFSFQYHVRIPCTHAPVSEKTYVQAKTTSCYVHYRLQFLFRIQYPLILFQKSVVDSSYRGQQPSSRGLALRKLNLLEKYFRGRVTWIDPTGDTKVEVKVTCTNNKQYTLRVYIPPYLCEMN